jgi:alkylhydroperoxidase family enzyme
MTKTRRPWAEAEAARAEAQRFIERWNTALRHAIQMAIGDELKSLYGVSPDVPPYFLAVLARLDGETATWGHG